MTEPLLSPTDFGRFKNLDESWFLEVVGEAIRNFCGWHIFPIVSTLGYQGRIGNGGTIMLPTTKLLSVEQITCGSYALADSMYEVVEAGWIEYGAPLGRRGRGKAVTVDFTHGYEECPKVVAEVGFELTATVLEKPAGVVTDMTRGPTRITFKELGSILTEDQRNRLGPYVVTLLGSSC